MLNSEPVPALSRSTGRRMGARDRGWLDVDHLRVLGPFVGVSRADVRAALAGMQAAQPSNPAVCLVDRSGARWVSMSPAGFEAYSQELVVELDAPAGSDRDAADAVARYLVDSPLGARPLLLAVCRGVVGAKISHAVGDGRLVNTLLPELIAAATQRRAARPPLAAPARLPLARAALHHFGRHPSRLGGALSKARSAAHPPAVPGTGETRPWRPDVAYVSQGAPTALPAIRAWRDAHAPGVSAAAVLFAATAVAFDRCGLPPRWPGAIVLVDARRYVPGGLTVAGNFSWGQYLSPGDLTDPRQVYDALKTQLSTGRALAMLALRAGRMVLAPGGTAPLPATVAAKPRPELTYTHVGRLDAYQQLPWATPADRRQNISVPTTSGPQAVTVSFTELDGVLFVNTSFHRTTFDPATIAAVVDLLCREPVSLVNGG